MAQPEPKRIMALDIAGPLTSSDTIALVQNTTTKRATLDQLSSMFEDACECTLVSRYMPVGTGNNTISTFLHTYTLPADVITVDGSWLKIHAAGTFAANGNTKYVSLFIKQDSTGLNAPIIAFPAFGYNDDAWLIEMKIQRSGATTRTDSGYISSTAANPPALATPGVINLTSDGTAPATWETGDLQFCIVASNGTASANDIVCNSFIIEAHLLDPNS